MQQGGGIIRAQGMVPPETLAVVSDLMAAAQADMDQLDQPNRTSLH